MILVIIAFCYAVFIYNKKIILQLENEKEIHNYYEVVETNVPKKNKEMIQSFFWQCVYVSILGSLLGLGGGVIMTPLLVTVF